MKKDIHPEYYENATITCACDATYEIGSTEKEISVELCANCHPFYTGKQKIIDSARRVERFEAMMKKHEEKSKDAKPSNDTDAKSATNEKPKKDIKEELEKVKEQINTTKNEQ